MRSYNSSVCSYLLLPHAVLLGERNNTYWFPNSDATNKKPVFNTDIAADTGTVSKYFRQISVTWKESAILEE